MVDNSPIGRALPLFSRCKLRIKVLILGAGILSGLFFPGGNLLYAQSLTIQARIVDSLTMQPVPFSTVIFSGTEGTISDAEGFFRYTLGSGEDYDSLVISCIGFNTREFAIANLTVGYLDTLYMYPAFKELDAVDIVEKRKRERSTQKILVDAINRIPENYADQNTVLTGYYREYMKQGDAYINLIETIVELSDPGISEPDSFEVVLRHKRFNKDFRLDSSLLNLYDESSKFVPFGLIPDANFNNLKILRFADPIRNFKDKSVSHFNEFRNDFINNHTFSNRKLTYNDEEPYYYISFSDDVYFTYGQAKVRMVGEMYIHADDYGIRNIKYTAILDHGFIKEKLFEINLEYIRIDGKYYLHYISHNNLFKHKNFYLESSRLRRGKLTLFLSGNPNEKSAIDPSSYVVEVNGFQQEIDQIDTRKDRITISFAKNSMIDNSDPSNVSFFKIGKRLKARSNLREIKKNMTLEIKSLVSEYGSPLANEVYSNYYQYRELFVREREQDSLPPSAPRMNMEEPMMAAKTYQEIQDTAWINTPLISEKLRETKSFSKIPLQNSYIQYNYRKLMYGTNEIAYIHTDREVYAPEDTLWFKGYLRNSLLLTPSQMSSSFYVKITDPEGTVIDSKKYLIEGGDIHGEFELGHSLEPGFYNIIGYSSWMKNFDNEALFRKKFLVKNEKRPGPQIFVECDSDNYYPGDSMQIRIHLKDEFNQDIEDENIRYEITAGESELFSGKYETRSAGNAAVQVLLPRILSTTPSIHLWTTYKSEAIDTTYALPVKAKLDVGFYPEGGRMITGITTRVAVSAISSDGQPAMISGSVVNESGKVIAEVTTNETGMGSFEIKPDDQEDLRLVVTIPQPLADTFALPSVNNAGWTLGLDNRRGNITARIQHTFNGERNGLMTVTMRGALAHYEAFRSYRRSSLEIPVDDLPAGVAVVTLFDEKMLPQAERLVYIPPRTDYRARISSFRTTYLPRDSVSLDIRIEADGRLHNGTYSLSVMDDFLGSSRHINEPNLLTHLLISNEIKGEIYNIDSYVNDLGEVDEEKLELLLLTQGWRSYQVEFNKLVPPTDRDAVYGKLERIRVGRTPEPIEGQITVYFGGNTTTVETRSDGSFSFTPEYTEESNTDVFISGTDRRGRNNNITIIPDSTEFEKNLHRYLESISTELNVKPVAKPETYYTFSDHYRYGAENHRWLEEVVIRKTVEQEDLNLSDYTAFSRRATPDQLEQAIDLEHMRELMRVPNPFDYTVWYSLDGQLQTRLESTDRSFPVEVPDSTIVNTIDPEQVKSYTVVYGPEAEALYGIGKLYVIDIETTAKEDRQKLRRGRNPLVIEKYDVARNFYAPKYDTKMKRDNPFPDLRKTIYWNPAVPIDENGKASIIYYNGDRYTRIRCILVGVTTDGIPVHGEYTYDIGTMRE